MSRDLGLHVSSKLSGDWSAGNVTSVLSEPVLEHLLSWWESMDPLVRARLLLSPLFLRKKDLHDLQPELQQMAEVGCGDRDEWVRVLARAVGPYDGRLHLDAVLKDSKLVGKTLNELRQLLEGADPTVFRPLEELYLNPDVRESLGSAAPSAAQQQHHQHFRAREPSEAPSARQPGAGSAAAPQRGVASSAAAAMAGGSHFAPRVNRPSSASGAADLFLPSKPMQRMSSGPHGGGALGSLFVGSGGGPRGGGTVARAQAAAAARKRPAILDPAEVKRMNEEAARERERKAAEEKAARAAERAAKAELKRKRSAAPGGAEQPSSKTPRTTDGSEGPQAAPAEQQQQQQQQPAGDGAANADAAAPAAVGPAGQAAGAPEAVGEGEAGAQQPRTDGTVQQQQQQQGEPQGGSSEQWQGGGPATEVEHL